MNDNTFEFKEATLAEASELALVLERANARRDGKSLPAKSAGKRALQDVKSRMHRMAAWTCVAACNGKIVGFALSHPLINPDNTVTDTNTQHLSLLMVDPDYWGQRIASQLIDRTVQRARNTGKRQVTLWTRQNDNARARAIYVHKGFAPNGTQRPNEQGVEIQYQLDL